MNAKNVLLAGVALAMLTTAASAQGRRGSRYVTPSTGFGAVTPFGTVGNPYGTGYNNYGYNQFNQPTYVQPQPGMTYSQNSYFTPPSTVVYPQNRVVPGTYVMPSTQFNTVTPASGTATGRTALKITEVKDGGPADKAGLMTGDVILAVDGKQTRTFDDLRSALKDTEKKEVNVEVWCVKTGKKETKSVMVKDTKVGVMVDETTVSQ